MQRNGGGYSNGVQYQGVPDDPYQGAGWGDHHQHEKQYQRPKKSRKLIWWIIGLVVLVCVIVGAVLGGVLGSRAAHNNDSNKSQDASAGNGNGSGKSKSGGSKAASSAAVQENLLVPTATDNFGNPMYPSSTGSATISKPTTLSNSALSCQSDPYSFSNPASLTVRNEHPLLFAPSYKWQCLQSQIPQDYYLSYWNDTIFQNATKFYDMSPTNYSIDGCLSCSGVLDVARQVKLKVRHWAYAWKVSNDTKWVDRTWRELQVAAGNTSQYFGVAGDNWNTQVSASVALFYVAILTFSDHYSQHFLDVGEFTSAFALAYDWMYDAWTPDQRTAIMWSIITLGLEKGLAAYSENQWWTAVNGNWNCVCNAGLTLGALAIANDDPTGSAQSLLAKTVPNAQANCAMAVQPDGTWTETANYWYFGTTGHAEMASALLSATGSTQELLSSNPAQNLSSLYHMYVTGQQGLFNYGDCGPNKYTATANGLMFYADQFSIPTYALFQRDRGDAPEPLSMVWYNPETSGNFWDGLPLDHYFDNSNDAWASMRSSWTDNDGVYVAIKAGNLTDHQTHGDLDSGDFVMDALGQRWAGELGSGDYLSEGYFSSETQDSQRWLYYRKRTEGQNTILVDDDNQLVDGLPTTSFDTTGEQQDALVYKPANSSTAYFSMDFAKQLNETSSAKRAIRLLNGRRQVLIRDELSTTASAAWRMHTNATVTLSSNNQVATLELGGQKLVASLRQPSNGQFSTAEPVRLSTDPALPSGQVDQPNPGVTVLVVQVEAGTNVIEVLFNPQWPGFSSNSFVDPPDVSIADWSLTSHDREFAIDGSVEAMYGSNSYRQSQDSAPNPLADVDYSSPYHQNNPNHAQDYGYDAPKETYGSGYTRQGLPKRKSRRPLWIALGVAIALIVILGAVLGGVFGSRAANDNNNDTNSSQSQEDANGAGGASGNSKSSGGKNSATRTVNNGASATSGSGQYAVKPTATDQCGNPMYPSSTGSARVSAPTFVANAALECPNSLQPDAGNTGAGDLVVRNEHPRLFARQDRWQCLPKLVQADSYMAYWNDTIMANASRMYDEELQPYIIDGSSGVLDVARQVQSKIHHWGYAYKMTNDTKWADRMWRELEHAAGNGTEPFGEAGDNWYTTHFLDVGEFTAAFAVAYDWLYDVWTQEQRTAIMWSIITLGLDKGLTAYSDGSAWWNKVYGNWNCVCNNGLILGALAISGDDPTDASQRILDEVVPNMAAQCSRAPSSDGSWPETPNYWYFGTTAHVSAAAALLSATGNDRGLLDWPAMRDSGLFHMATVGKQGLFSYGDAGPNKFIATANGLMFYGSIFNVPEYTLFQRDRGDAPEPMSMMYYDPQVSGSFFSGLELDQFFDNATTSWVSMRSSWTDNNGLYVAMKASTLTGHETHGDLDAGTFVLDAMGERWAGELGNGDYLSEGYFSSESQDSDRWLYYRKRTEGQNTILLDGANQLVAGVPTHKYQSTMDKQADLVYTPQNTSTAYLTTDLTSFYDATSVRRAIRLINGRRQVLLQDEIDASAQAQWRMHTNATVSLSNNGATATLELNGKSLVVEILEPASGVAFTTQENPTRIAGDPALPSGQVDQPNDGVTLLSITTDAPTIAVLFTPQYEGVSQNSYLTPPLVPIQDWALRSHD
ncbi:hypothetical protein OIV83_005074 [Microbotryomycetes sp. JL201]|nr:hypothetical protein OIV83_005074 [Microbotryomycetes sp. JL201]